MNPNIDHIDELIKLRHTLHAHPELSGFEKKTAQIIKDYLGQYEPCEIIENLGGHGLAAIYRGKNDGPRILVRAELDALPIQEENNTLDYASSNSGTSHKCGHDGHMTIVAGLAKILKETPTETGEVVLLFQPSEENGMGAHAVCTDKKFKSIKPDYAFALHNVPGEPFGEIICKTGPFSSSVESLIVKIKGTTSHAAEPNKASSAGEVMAKIMSWTYSLNASVRDEEHFQRVSLVRAVTGEEDSYGTTAGNGELHYTIRTRTPAQLNALMQEIKSRIEKEISAYNESHKKNLSCTFEQLEPFMACMNNEDAVSAIKTAAQNNALNYTALKTPNDWGEDFGYFTNLDGVKGALFGLGSGENSKPLHHPLYDFPDELIPKGIMMFHDIIRRLNS